MNLKTKRDFDSQEEFWIYLYILELQKADYIKSFECQPEPFKLFDGLKRKFYSLKQLKTKVSKKYTKKQYLINPHIYTADFKIEWNDLKSLDVLHQSIDENLEINTSIPFIENELDVKGRSYYFNSYFEVKGSFDRNNATRLFTSRTQPWVYQKFGIYVQLIKPLELFKKTFIPEAILHNFYYQKSGKWGNKGDKKYKWQYKTLKEYLK